MGHLIHKLGLAKDPLDQDEIIKGNYRRVLARRKEEKLSGKTINLSFKDIRIGEQTYTIVDTPGDVGYGKNEIVGVFDSDYAIFVISAIPSELYQSLSVRTIEQHALILRSFSIHDVILVVNKMEAVGWDRAAFQRTLMKVKEAFERRRYRPRIMEVIPTSGLTGANLIAIENKADWYDGISLHHALSKLRVQDGNTRDQPLRLPVQGLFNREEDSLVITARLQSGSLRIGDKIVIMPQDLHSSVKSLENVHSAIDEAGPGENIGARIVAPADRLKRGMIGSHAGSRVASDFVANLFVYDHPTIVRMGYTPVFHIHCAHVRGTIHKIISRTDEEGHDTSFSPSFIQNGDHVRCRIHLLEPTSIESVLEFPTLSRFAIRDNGLTIGGGTVEEVL